MLAKSKLVLISLSALVVGYGLMGGLMKRVSAEKDDVYSQLAIFTEILQKIQSDYVETPDMAEAMGGALQGMIEALDPFSSFVPAKVFQELEPNLKESASTGLRLAKRYGYIFVVAVDRNSPAEEAGLRTGDLLESIGGVVTTRMSVWEANARMLGPAGSSIQLRVVRARRSQPSEISLKREILESPEVSGRVIESGIGLLIIPHFNEGAAEQVQARLKMLLASGVKGILVDVRDNAQGDFQEGVKSADLFLAEGVKILTARNREGGSVEFPSLQPPLTDLPLVLLVDGGTSGAAEIFVAALHDNDRAEMVGERTNGQGSLQQPFPISDGAMLFVSTTLFLRPNDKPIQASTQRASGIQPDEKTPSQEFITNFYFENASDDLPDDQLDEFYKKLDLAIEEQRLESGLQAIRKKVLEKKAA